ncbi:MAG: hypothetical protein N2749_04645 [Clostridia bacterium]|nr:hypothetical protein [Clostridia bacterium]
MLGKVNTNKINKYSFYILLIIMSIIMIFFISQKKGFHCDEIFSYGSSSYEYESIFHPYGQHDPFYYVLKNDIFNDNILTTAKNILYYFNNPDAFSEKTKEYQKNEKPIWRTGEEAKQYVTVSPDNRFNFVSVYYNQARDVHPPLFYMLVNIVSSILAGTFSKYIIFSISMIFFIASCFVIKKIMEKLEMQHLLILVIIAYGFSMGAISTVLFQRMYMMLTFFVLYFLYLNICIRKNDYKIDKKTKIKLMVTTVLGFLTQYYFCIYVLFLVIVMIIFMLKKKKYSNIKKYLTTLIISAVIGVSIFPSSISHMFFSYRGVGSFNNTGYLERIYEYAQYVFSTLIINSKIIMFGAIVLITFMIIFKLIKGPNKELLLMLGIPVLLYTLVIAKISPYIELRYVMCILPISVIFLVLLLTDIPKISKKLSISILLLLILSASVYQLMFQKPLFLYEEYATNMNISEKYRGYDYILITDNTAFNQIHFIPECINYRKILMLTDKEISLLEKDIVVKYDKEFIVNIYTEFNAEEILNKILQYSGHTKIEQLSTKDDNKYNVFYRIYD